MTVLLLCLSSISFGWFAWIIVFEALTRFSKYQQSVRLKNLMTESVVGSGQGSTRRKSMPFQTLLSFFESSSNALLKRKVFERYLSYLSKQLLRMHRVDIKPVQILGYQVFLSILALVFFGLLSENLEISILAFILGAALPLIWLQEKALGRERTLLRELPNALEILSLCSEAGLSLEQAMDQYLKNAKVGPLHDEFSSLLEQTRTGSSRKSALESTSIRLNLTDFSLFTTSLIHAERFGTGISMTLRQLSLTMRDKQTQRAEKAVQEMPVKMLIPLILFIMPVTFLIIFGPILLQFFNQ
jgi:Flp pilus assembly protein TadB